MSSLGTQGSPGHPGYSSGKKKPASWDQSTQWDSPGSRGSSYSNPNNKGIEKLLDLGALVTKRYNSPEVLCTFRSELAPRMIPLSSPLSGGAAELEHEDALEARSALLAKRHVSVLYVNILWFCLYIKPILKASPKAIPATGFFLFAPSFFELWTEHINRCSESFDASLAVTPVPLRFPQNCSDGLMWRSIFAVDKMLVPRQGEWIDYTEHSCHCHFSRRQKRTILVSLATPHRCWFLIIIKRY